MKTSKAVLLDTNVLIYNQDRTDPRYQASHTWHLKADKGDVKAFISNQNLLEFSSVMVNHKRVTQPLTQKQVSKEISAYLSHPHFHLISPTKQTLVNFINLLQQYPLTHPRQTFDLYLVATMITHDIHTIVTANIKDFQFIKEITPVAL